MNDTTPSRRPLSTRGRRGISGAVLRAFGPLMTVLLMLVPVACDDEPAPPFEVEGEGSLSGFLFLDADGDGSFAPRRGDVALADVPVQIRVRNSDEILSGGQAVTDETGRFTVANLPPGTHDVFVDPSALPENAFVCQNPIPATVFRGEQSSIDIEAQVGCVISIAEALQTAQGEVVTVSGIVTAAPGQIRSGLTYIEDASGGIAIFGLNTGDQTVENGDRIEVSGTLGNFFGELQLTSATLNELEQDVTNPVPLELTTAEVAAAGGPVAENQGRLVVVRAAELVQEFGGGDLVDENALIDDASGEVQIRIENDVLPAGELNATFSVGTCYDITGVIGSFQGAAQLKPRSVDDLVEVPCGDGA